MVATIGQKLQSQNHKFQVRSHAMRHVGFALTLAVLILSGCGGETKTVTTTVIATEPVAPAPEQSGEDATTKTGEVGDTLVLRGDRESVKVAVTLVGLIDPFQAPRTIRAGPRTRFVAAELHIRNVGTATYEDSFGGEKFIIVDSSGRQYEALFTHDDASDFADALPSRTFLGSLRVIPNDERRGLAVWRVAKSTDLKTLQIAIGFGFSIDTGVWTL